jgi:acyl-CoA synthetase (AMP-forming)/AMP-acid ligase II
MALACANRVRAPCSRAMALDMRASDRQLHALPLYHSAQMHVFLMPSLTLGAPNWLLEGPDPTAVLDQIAAHQIVACVRTWWRTPSDRDR